MFNKNIKLVLAALITIWSVYEFTQGHIMNGISILLLAGIFILFYFKNEFIFSNPNSKLEAISNCSSKEITLAFGYGKV